MIVRAEHKAKSGVTYDHTHDYPTYGGRTIRCRVRVVSTQWHTLVILTDVGNDIHSSTTLHIEELATSVCGLLNIDGKDVIWVEHIPACPSLGKSTDLFDLIHFQERNGIISQPYWTPLSLEELNILTNGLLSPIHREV